MKKILVSLVSDQTIPNVEFIKEKINEVDQFLFLTTSSMEKRGNREWILNTTNIPSEKLLDPVLVNAFSFEDIEEKLIEVVNTENTYVVNLTGGTKIMSLATYEFFKDFTAEMYYLIGNGKYIRLHPGRKKTGFELKTEISLKEYLTAYGFDLKNSSEPLKGRTTAEKMLQYFLTNFDKEKDIPVLAALRSGRGRSNTAFEKINGIEDFLLRVNFSPSIKGKLTKYECRYLTGDWLEEYFYYFLIDHFDVKESQIGLSWIVEKSGSTNEFDVLLMRNNKLYLFECKTSIYIDSEESRTFITETIYKSDSLRNKFGLFTQTTVVTLSNLKSQKLAKHIERAEVSRVKLIGKESFKENLKEALSKI